MKKIVVSGSIAYDTIMKFDQEFADLILPDQIKNLNVCFNISQLEKSNGGTGHNIAYSLGLLGCRDQTILFAGVGKDFKEDPALAPVIDYSYIYKDKNLYTASANMITEKKENQIITFYPGALVKGQELSIESLPNKEDIAYVLLSPNGKASLKFAAECKKNQLLSFFDPGQEVGLYSPQEMQFVLQNVNYPIANEYEFELVKNISGLSQDELMKNLDKIIITLGKDGVKILDEGGEINIPGLVVENVVDPTGCGDAFRSGLLYGLINEKSWEESAKIANVVGAFVVQSQGGMNHSFTLDDILQKYQETYQQA